MPKPKCAEHQEALYDVEHVVGRSWGIRWKDVRDVRAYVEQLVESSWFDERWPDLYDVGVERRGSGSTFSTGESWSVDGIEVGVLLLAELSQITVLHELAHLCVPNEDHSNLFVETLLTLIRHEMGVMAWAEYYDAIRATPWYASIRERSHAA